MLFTLSTIKEEISKEVIFSISKNIIDISSTFLVSKFFKSNSVSQQFENIPEISTTFEVLKLLKFKDFIL